MMNMHSKYDNICKNGMSNTLNFINIHVITSISCMLSETSLIDFMEF